ncbi:MAG: DUF177 domain-containing protein [Burkholderiaceae bacterium]|nr:DUF177 domain-containing protein [Burkholderiaceae bacterium]
MNAKFDLNDALSSVLLERALDSGALPASGTLSADAFLRLADSVVAVLGPVQWAFQPDDRPLGPGHPRRRWWLSARVEVTCTCERCLEPVRLQLSARRGFEFFETSALADAGTERIGQAEEALDPALAQVDFLSPEDGASLQSLIEDELLLELPMAPKHGDCLRPGGVLGEVSDTRRVSDTSRPFAGLKDLLKKT